MKLKTIHLTFCRHGPCYYPKNKSVPTFLYVRVSPNSFLENSNKNTENNNRNVVKVTLLELVRSIRKRTEITCHTRYLSFSPIHKNQNLDIGANLVYQSLSFHIIPSSSLLSSHSTSSRCRESLKIHRRKLLAR